MFKLILISFGIFNILINNQYILLYFVNTVFCQIIDFQQYFIYVYVPNNIKIINSKKPIFHIV